jgi:hypothetical protein
MRSPPLSVLASWPTPNYVNPQTRGPAGKIVGSILITLVTVILVLRLYTRRFISKGLGIDDVLIILAYVRSSSLTWLLHLLNYVTDTRYGACYIRHRWRDLL